MPEQNEALPKYRQIAEDMRDRVLRGDLRPGEEVPSERNIAVQYEVSRPTATKALDLLRREGFVESRQGSGTYVADQGVHRRARERYARSRETGRIYPPDEYAVIVAAELVAEAPDHVRTALELPAGAAAVRRQRVTNNAQGPRELSTSWFPGDIAELAPKVLVRERIFEGTVAYLEAMTGRRGNYARDRVRARFATAEEAQHLALDAGTNTPVLTVEHIVCDSNDRPIEFAEAIYPPGRWTYEQQYELG